MFLKKYFLKNKKKKLKKLIALNKITILSYNSSSKFLKIYRIIRWSIRYIFFKTSIQISNNHDKFTAYIFQFNINNREDLNLDNFNLPKNLYNNIELKLKFEINLYKLLDFILIIFLSKFQILKFFSIITFFELDQILNTIKKNSLKPLPIIFFNEKQYWDGLFCYAFENLGFKTFSVVHGFYRDTGHLISLNNTNPHNYLNLISKNHITYGEIQKKIMMKYNRHSNINFISLGKPKLIFYQNPKYALSKSLEHILVLDTKELMTLNDEMISYLKNSKVNFFIKKHPDDESYYEYQIIKNFEDLNNSSNKYFYGCNSSAILQLGRAGFNIFLYEKSDFLKYIDTKYQEKQGKFIYITENFSWEIFIKKIDNEFYYNFNNIIKR